MTGAETDTAEKLYNMEEAAAYIERSRQRVYYLVMDGKLKPIKIKSKNYFSNEMLSDYLAKYRTVKQ